MSYPKGKPRSPESKARISAALQARFAASPSEVDRLRAQAPTARLRHGEAVSRTPEYGAWKRIRNVCLNPSAVKYDRYGGRGIRCEFPTFESFIECIGRRPGPGYSVDRIDNDGPYAPGNVRWATSKEQANNRAPRRFNRAQCEAIQAENAALKDQVHLWVALAATVMEGRLMPGGL